MTAPVLTHEQKQMLEITETVSGIVLARPTGRRWIIGFALAFALLMVFLFAVAVLMTYGVGIWGVNIPVAWGFAIVNFVWWVGIAHAGTLISAILLLCKQDWRTSINRFAEAMTLFAVACAGVFPLLHLGRPWFFYWLLPYPSTMGIWPQFRSPLIWDVFAVSTYATVSTLFWYLGLIPDLAIMRERAERLWVKRIYGALALGWQGSARQWARHKSTYLLLAALITPLVVSVHSVVSFDFAVGLVPGWHSTIFPPYFVAGAICSGLALVLTISIPIRRAYRLQDYITARHLENMAKIMYVTAMFVSYGYVVEGFMAWYSASRYERFMMYNRLFGPYGEIYWLVIFCVLLAPQLLWSQRVRRSELWLFVTALIVNTGMWLERFVIVVSSLNRDFMPSAWHYYHPTWNDYAVLFGSLGLFATAFYLFVRFVPLMAAFELKELFMRKDKPA